MQGDDQREETEAAEQGGFSMQDMLAIVRRRLWLILSSTALAGGAAAAVCVVLPNRYEAVTTVQIDQRAKKIVNIEGVLSDLKADTPTVESEVEIIRSKAIALRVIEALNLRSDPEFTEAPAWQRWLGRAVVAKAAPVDSADADAAPSGPQPGSFSGPAGAGREPERDEIARVFDARLRAVRLRNTLLIEVHFSSADPVKAARIANLVAEIYVKSQIEAKTQATEFAGGLLDEKIKGLRDRVAEAERKVERFKSENNIFDADGHLLADRQLAREMEALVIGRNNTGQAKARFEQARRMMLDGEGNEAVADVLQSHTVRLLRDEFTKALRREAELATKYGPKHPDMQKVSADVAKAQGELTVEISKIIRNLKTEYEVAVDRERQQSRGLEALKGQIAASKDKQWELRELEREAAANRQIYESLLARNKQTAEMLSLQLPDSRIIGRADVPLFPAVPKRKQIVAIGLAGGLALGLGLAFLLEFGSSGIRRPEDVEKQLDLPHLGSLPELKGDGGGPPDPLKAMRLILASPRGSFAEAVRGVRHEIDSRRRRGAPSVILVASSLPNEGKTMVASNLAHHYAVTGDRTLLIDADMRKARLTRLFRVEHQPGLLEVLCQGVAVEQAILRDGVSGLYFLPAASSADAELSAPEMLAGPHMGMMLARLRSEFDTVVIDAPPLLPVVDARIIADSVDQIVFVATWKKTPQPLARRALKNLGAGLQRVVGVVVNQVDPGQLAVDLGYRDGRQVDGYARNAA